MEHNSPNNNTENNQNGKKPSWEKLTLFVSVAGLIVSIILAQINNAANIKLEEKKIESDLFIKAIDIGNNKKSLKNLTFLLKLGILPEERQIAIQKLTDSIYSEKVKNIPSDTVGFYSFQFFNNKKDVSLHDHQLRGAHIFVSSLDTISNPLQIIGYSDYQGKYELTFPKYYSSSFINVRIKKSGYKTREFKMQLPKFGETTDLQKDITMIAEK